MTTRLAKLLFFATIGLLYTLIVLNNLTDFDSNYQFVRHVLLMDSTFPGNQGMWRPIQSPALHLVFYWSIIVWEFVTMILFWWGDWVLLRQLKRPSTDFNAAKRIPIAALTLGLLLWLGAFTTVGGEWFLMWQSSKWNGQQAAFRMILILGLALLLLLQPEREDQP